MSVATSERLRLHGFTIMERKKGREPQWKKIGGVVLYPESAAIEICNRETMEVVKQPVPQKVKAKS